MGYIYCSHQIMVYADDSNLSFLWKQYTFFWSALFNLYFYLFNGFWLSIISKHRLLLVWICCNKQTKNYRIVRLWIWCWIYDTIFTYCIAFLVKNNFRFFLLSTKRKETGGIHSYWSFSFNYKTFKKPNKS